jgi:hypothetical protein
MAFLRARLLSLALVLPLVLLWVASGLARSEGPWAQAILRRSVELLPILYLVFFTWMYFRWRERVRLTGGRRCPNCDYDVSGLPDAGTCPECSEPYDVNTNLRNADLPTGEAEKPSRL